MKKILLVLLCLALLLGGCAEDTGGQIFRYDTPAPVENLDPQSATDPAARMLLGNLMEGLVVRTEGGGIGPGVAAGHTVSPDGLRYTFRIREGAVWRDGESVTAEDFVFAFRRLFSYSTGLAALFSAIQNAPEILAGERDASALGVRAEDNGALVFTLSQPDALFLERLCDPAALPCHEAFFLETKGRYGLEPSSVLTNGPFYLSGWDNSSRIELRASESYVSARPSVAGGVNVHIGREDAVAEFLAGNSDLAWIPFDRLPEPDAAGSETVPIQRTVWCLVFNQNHPVWGNPLLRQGLARAVDRERLGEALPAGFRAASALVPEAVQMMGRSYRDRVSVSADSLPGYDPQEGARLFELGLSVLGREALPDNSAVVLPQLASSSLPVGALKQGWQNDLAAYLNFTVESDAQIKTSLQTAEYQILLLPLTPKGDDVTSLLSAFQSGSPDNYFGYRSVLYDGLLQSAGVQPTVQLAAEEYAKAEALLLSDAVVIPLFFETSYLALGNETADLVASPLGDQLYFKYARRKG